MKFRIKAVPYAVLWVVAVVVGIPVGSMTPGKEARMVIEPKETDALFANPGMGWQTFHAFADDDPNLAGLPSASVYVRFYWREIEPAEGKIAFDRLDALMDHARKAGQKVAFRVMCTGSGEYMDVPAWLREKGCRGYEFEYEGRRHWVPDFEDSRFQEAHFRLIRELGRRYDSSPSLDLVDIGSVGLWGEWHMSGTKDTVTGREVPLPSARTRLAIVDAWRQAFPRTSKVMLIGDEECLRHAAQKGCGWRADCLGDMGGFSKTWNHMEHFYVQQLEKAGAQEAWKTGPVAFESCWDMRKWKQEGWDIRYIFDYALRLHASYMNNKSAPLPEGTREEVERFLRRLGYRLVLRRWEHASSADAGKALPIAMTWENVGVAPPYRDYRLAVRLDPERGARTKPVVLRGKTSIRGWLPGRRRVTETPVLPARLPPGRYRVLLGLVAPSSDQPAVRLAIDIPRTPKGWYPLSTLEVRTAGPSKP